MDLFDWFFKQRVNEGELDELQTHIEVADQNIMNDQDLVGLMVGGSASQHAPTADLTIDLTSPIVAYDQEGQRIQIPGTGGIVTVDVSQDSNSVSTDVIGGGNSKIVSVFIEFDRAESDPQTDGNGLTVNFRKDEAFNIIVEQGAEAASNPPPPALKPDAILIADITRTFGQTQIFNADIDQTRTEYALKGSTADYAVAVGTQEEAVQALLQHLQDHVDGIGAQHDASGLAFPGSTNIWADGSGISAGSVESAIDEIPGDLGGSAGASRIGFNPGQSTWEDLSSLGSTDAQAAIDEVVDTLSNTSGAEKIGVSALLLDWAPSGGFTVSGGNIQEIFDDIVSDLAADGTANNGGAKIGWGTGFTWRSGETVQDGDVHLGLTGIITRLSDDLGTNSGAYQIGFDGASISNIDIAGASISVAAALEDLDQGKGSLANANTWATTNTFNGVVNFMGANVFMNSHLNMVGQIRGTGDDITFRDGGGNDDARLLFDRAVLSGTNNPLGASAPAAGTLYRANVVKAWARIQVDGAGNATLTEGFNISAVAIVGATGHFDVDFHTSVGTSARTVCTLASGTTPRFVTVDSPTSLGVQIYVWDATGTQLDLNSNSAALDLIVLGSG